MTVPLDALLAGSADAREAGVLVVVAHSDDEILGCGALLSRLRRVQVIHVTDGAPREGTDFASHGFASPGAYAGARRAEALAALALAGHPWTSLTCLGLPDQQASLHMAETAREIARRMVGVDFILTHAYEGGHPDHDAVAFAVHAATHRVAAQDAPAIVEMPFYHGDVDGWVRQVWLPHPEAGPEIAVRLDPAARALKARLIEAYATQAETLHSFSLDVERFRIAPPYDFRGLPHAGPLLYERHAWNLTGPQWLTRVRAAMTDLGLVPWR